MFNKYTKQAVENIKKYRSAPVYNDDVNIDDIDLEDIHKDMVMYSFIGKTIIKVLHTGESVWFKFSDGTTGHIFNSFPITHYGRDVYNQHREKGELNICGFCSDEPWITQELSKE